MTMLNSASTAASTPASTGSTGGAGTRPAGPAAQPHGEPKPAAEPKLPPLHLLGSGAAPVEEAGRVAPRAGVVVALDQFAKQGGPDASVQTDNGPVNVHVVFQLDDKTHELSVAIVNQDGQLIRMIPPESVSRMIAAMAAYRGR